MSKSASRLSATTCVLVLLTSLRLLVQGPAQGTDVTLDTATRVEVIEGTLKALNDFYVFPDVAAKMARSVRDRRQRHEYDSISSSQTLAEVLTTHLQEVSHDKHLRVGYSATVLPPMDARPSPDEIERQQQQARAVMSQVNFGFERVERLAGNIGYLDLRGFMPPQMMGDTAAAAMNFFGNVAALIIDLRQNGGGSPDAVALMASYLVGPQPVRLNDIYDRPSDQTHQFWTLPYVPGKRLVGKDVYVLTSGKTFSAAEDFSYAMKNLKRATVVGEVTGGGAHPGGPRRINDHFFVAVPSGRSISTVTKTDWEGVGVEPDIKVPADRALATAHLMALEKRAPEVTEPRLKSEIAGAIERLKTELGASPRTTLGPIQTGGGQRQPSIVIDDFESGTLASWTVKVSGAGGWFIYTKGQTPPDPSKSDPNVPFNVPDPPQGKFAAVTDMNGPGTRILYRDVKLDGRYTLHLMVFYVNAGVFSSPETLDYDTIGDNQQFRIDLVSPSTRVDSLAKGDVLANIFHTAPGDPDRRQPSDVTFDLSPWQDQIVRLRLASADNRGPLRVGVDNIRLEPIGR